MSAEVTTAIVAVVVATIGAVGSCAAAYIARRAERNTRSVGNGFASDVHRKLDRIEDRLERVDGAMQAHLDAHADRDLRAVPTRRPAQPDTWQGDSA